LKRREIYLDIDLLRVLSALCGEFYAAVNGHGVRRVSASMRSAHAAANNNQEGSAMEKQQTLRILNALANGVHPATGEKFAADSPYQHPDTVRALFEALRAVDGGAAAPAAERKPPLPQSGSGSRWSREEEQRLMGAFDAGKSVDELARAHSRSRVAIEARLVRLGKLDASAVTMPLRFPPKATGGQTQRGA
jgi:hypothetical protein